VFHGFGIVETAGTFRNGDVLHALLSQPVTERVEGTLVTTMFGVQKGCMFVRVHDVKENVRTIKMCEAILNSSN
jgi:dihydropteroate synthase